MDVRAEAVRAVQVASEHAHGERVRAREDMEEGLLLRRVALQGAHVAVRHQQGAALVVAHLADASQPVQDQALVGARVAPHLLVRQLLVERPQGPLGDPPIEGLGERSSFLDRHALNIPSGYENSAGCCYAAASATALMRLAFTNPLPGWGSKWLTGTCWPVATSSSIHRGMTPVAVSAPLTFPSS